VLSGQTAKQEPYDVILRMFGKKNGGREAQIYELM